MMTASWLLKLIRKYSGSHSVL